MSLRKILLDSVINLFSKKDLLYIVEPKNWSIKWDGYYITKKLELQGKLSAQITTSRFMHRNKILHFGSVGSLIDYEGLKKVHPSNKIVCTWFHISPDDIRNTFIPVLNDKVEFIHTSCEITKNELIKYGLNPEKIIIVPIGIDLETFKNYNFIRKNELKAKLGIPNNKVIIGSFQKDGVGWGQGNEAKLIKGPDIFCDVIEKLARDFDIHVLLTGPARGYVKNRLLKAGILFTHHYFNNYFDIVNYYNVLDLYLLTSRVEGGPKAITESMACGVPIVSTRMGMAPEVIIHEKNGLLSDIEDVQSLLANCRSVLDKENLRNNLINNGLNDVKKYSWEIVAKQLYNNIYSQIIES